MKTVTVDITDRYYRVTIGAGARQSLPSTLNNLPGITRVAIVADQLVADLHLDRVTECLDVPAAVITFPSGESSKSLDRLDAIYSEFANAHLGRDDLVITLGGGVAGDLGGFAAATWMRGMRFVQLPTTLLAAIDASIGGKTGVNHAAGKNLIGAFHQPSAVIVDTGFLATLDRRDFIAGLGESIKHAVIRDAAFFDWHESHVEAILSRDPETLDELIARNCQIKAEVVASDEREADLRMILNYGHTIGHAIEHLLQYELRHGECVALGMLVANEIAARRGLLPPETANRITRLIKRCGLPVRLPRPLAPGEVAAACRLDKKVRSGALNFVLVHALGAAQRHADVSDDEITAALAVINAD